MARVEAVVICLLVLAMDVAAGVLGVYAEKAQNQASFRVVGKLFSFHCRVSGNQGGRGFVRIQESGWLAVAAAHPVRLAIAGQAPADPVRGVPAAGPAGLRARHGGGRGAGGGARHRQRGRRMRVRLLRRQAPPGVAQPADGVLRLGPHMVRYYVGCIALPGWDDDPSQILACILHSTPASGKWKIKGEPCPWNK